MEREGLLLQVVVIERSWSWGDVGLRTSSPILSFGFIFINKVFFILT
jgi:hypothetical protein